eukprot:CAMPEP_0117470970 /NCGR_PEP_ID=MMETSP0784-20121206/7492_1 /TAXON_ID=39447 /ORGANISM="" /LENGTH=364 /DNA_ID=CAMNT_0005265079 /DNA_START=127 /DNA_END=1218 /DNA_ORIENTATION=+
MRGAWGRGKGGFMEEDRTFDWYCPICRERNFAKRFECFKCRSARPADAETVQAPRMKPPPQNGTTMQGMVKSYNKKGFGFIMCLGEWECQDIHYTRENVSSRLFNPDMPGEHVSFEIFRTPEGRLTAKNIRPSGESRNGSCRSPVHSDGGFGGRSASAAESDDMNREWTCIHCRERNYAKRFECFKCKMPRRSSACAEAQPVPTPASAPPRRTFSPHAGARAIRESLLSGRGGGNPRSTSRRNPRRKRQESDSSSSSSSSRNKKKKEKKLRKRRSRSRSSSSGSSKKDHSRSRSNSSSCVIDDQPPGGVEPPTGGSPEIDRAKAEALEQLMKLKSVEPKEARMTEWRALLRHWHPDKNPQRVEV